MRLRNDLRLIKRFRSRYDFWCLWYRLNGFRNNLRLPGRFWLRDKFWLRSDNFWLRSDDFWLRRDDFRLRGYLWLRCCYWLYYHSRLRSLWWLSNSRLLSSNRVTKSCQNCLGLRDFGDKIYFRLVNDSGLCWLIWVKRK